MLDRLSKRKRNIGLLVVLATVGWFLWTVRAVLNPLILGYLLAFVLHPAVLHLERRRGWSRPRAVNAIFLFAAFFITGTAWGIYYQGRQLVEAVSTVNAEDDVLKRAEARIDAFLAKARSWSDRWTRDDEPAEGDAADTDDEPPASEETPAPVGSTTEGAAGGPPVTEALRGDSAGTDGAPAEPETSQESGEDAGVVAPETRDTESARGDTAAPVHGASGQKSEAAHAGGAAAAEEATLRDLVRAWWKGYVARTEGGAGAVALQNAPAVLVLLVNFFGSIVSLAGLVLLLPIYGYFLLFELERIHRFVRRHVPKGERERITRIGTQIGEVIANFFRGRLLICVLKGSVITIGLALVGGPYPVFFGVMAGLMSLVPFVGPTLTFVLAMVFGLQELSLVSALVRIGGVFLLGEFLEGYVFIPKILGDSLGLHPVVVLVSIFAGGASLGMFGFLIAIPLMAALVIVARELLLPALRQFADEDSHVDEPRSGGPPSGAGWQGGAPG